MLIFPASAVLEVHGSWAFSKIGLQQGGMVRRASCVDGAKDRYLLSGDSVCEHGFVCLDAPFQVLGERPAFLGQRKNDAPAVAGQAPPLNQTPVDQVRRRAACARRWERQRMDQPSGNPRLKSRKEPEGGPIRHEQDREGRQSAPFPRPRRSPDRSRTSPVRWVLSRPPLRLTSPVSFQQSVQNAVHSRGLPSAVLLREADAADVFSAVEDRHPEEGLRGA